MDERSAAPTTRWYRAAWLTFAAGVIAAILWWGYASTRVHDAVYDFDVTPAFGGVVELRAGRHTLWIEGDCLTCRGNEPSEYRDAASIDVRGPSGEDVPLQAASDRWLYNTGSREGRALWVFDVDDPGSYRVRFSLNTDSPEWDNRLPARLAFGEGAGLPVTIVRPMVAIVAAATFLAVGLTAVTWVRRKRFFDRRYPASTR